MQTFLPFGSFDISARCLDRARLGKQRVETLQILKAIREGGAWSNHPATLMWKNHINSLVEYGVCVCNEWIFRGYKDTCLPKIKAYWGDYSSKLNPRWLGDERLHESHRSNLIRKDVEFYGRMFISYATQRGLPYFWPTKEGY